MRSVITKHGVDEYLSCLRNIESISRKAGNDPSLQYALFDFHRVDGPPEIIEKIIDFFKVSIGLKFM